MGRIFVLVAAYALAQVGLRRGLGAARLGLALGAIGCVAFSSLRARLHYPAAPIPNPTSWGVVAAAVPALGLGFVRHRILRRAGTLAVLAIPVWHAASRSVDDLFPGRPDLGPPTAEAAANAPNLLLVVLDTVRADHLAPYGHERVTTPALDAWVAEHATRYERARSTSSWTLASHASLFTGLYPAQHGATAPRHDEDAGVRDGIAMRPAMPLRGDVPTLAEKIRNAGYRTAAVVANNAYLTHPFGLHRGFEHYDDRNGSWVRRYLALVQLAGWNPRAGHKVYREGGDISDAALAWLERRGAEPFFLMLNYMDAHDPYIPPPPFDREFSDEQPLDPLDPAVDLWPLLYDRGLCYLDEQLARVLDHLERNDRMDDTVVIVTADHGEAFGEHDFWVHAWVLYEEVLHVPLYVKPAGGRAREVEQSPISGVEIPALALALLGLADEPPPEATGVVGEWYAGRSNPGIDAWAERVGRDLEVDLLAWIEDGVKFIADSGGALEAYDLRVDPGEEHPLELPEERRAAALARARLWWEEHPPVDPELTSGEDLDAEAIERLRALGYIGDG